MWTTAIVGLVALSAGTMLGFLMAGIAVAASRADRAQELELEIDRHVDAEIRRRIANVLEESRSGS